MALDSDGHVRRRSDTDEVHNGGWHGLRPTRQRVAVLTAVERLGVFTSAQAIHDDLVRVGERVGLSTVYRSLHALAERGTLDAVRGHDGEVLYRKCQDALHHHLVCRRCGEAVEIPGAMVLRAADRWARDAGYVDTEVVLEVFGLCPRCVDASR